MLLSWVQEQLVAQLHMSYQHED
ncbi:hypothetical protein EMIT0194P_90012 [Pseudomonas serbica]